MKRIGNYMKGVSRVVVTLGTLLIILQLNIGFAQDIDFRGERPTEPMFDRYGGPKACWIVVEGARFFNCPDESEVLGEGKFRDTYYVCRERKEKGKEYLLLGKVDENYKITDFVGWLRSEDGLADREAQKTEHSIYRKALIINRWRKAKGVTELEGAKVYKGPDKDYEEIKELGLFKFHYIYKRGGKIGGDDYRLLGTRTIILEDKRPQDVLIGWVNSERIYEWDTRQAVEIKKDNIDERKEPVQIFENIPDIEYYMQGIKKNPHTKEPIEPVAVEDMGVKEWEYYYRRFPLIATQPSDFGIRLFQVGYIGDEIQISGEGRRPAFEVAEEQMKLEEIKKEFRNVDILFVIDATGSMEIYFPSAAQAVEKIVETLRKEYRTEDSSRLNMHFSVGFYRDYCHRPSLWKRCPLTPDNDYKKVIDYLKAEHVCRNCPEDGGDEPEAVFYGICNAIKEAEFREGSIRAVILLGDKGNHPKGEDEEGYTEEKVIQALREKDVALFAMHVVDRAYIERDRNVDNFEKQTKKIINGLSSEYKLGQYFIDKEPSEVVKVITGSMVQVKRLSENTQKGTEEVGEGTPLSTIRQKYGLIVADKIVKAMQAKGLDPKIIAERRIQIFDEGVLAEFDPKTKMQQAEVVMLMSRYELEILTGILAGITAKVASPKNIRTIWKEILEKEVGEKYDVNIPISEYIQKHLGLPVRENLLKMSLDRLTRLRIDQIRDLQERLRVKLGDLRDIMSERKSEIKVIEGKSVRVPLGERKYFWREGGIEFAWVPIECLP